jgi:hypothetical protein
MWMQCSKIFEKQSKEIKQCLAADRKAGKAPRLIIVENTSYRWLSEAARRFDSERFGSTLRTCGRFRCILSLL